MRSAAALALLFAASTAEARFRRPFAPDARVTAHFDNDRRSGPMRDYACGQHTYDNHTGTDFGVYFTDIYAVANGVVESAWQGCANYGSLGNTCGDRCGNGIRLRLDDGTRALYCHLKNGSFVVSVGQRVGCGQKIAVSASSGSSTGPHLHLTWTRGGVLTDNYAGSCSGSPGAWVQQRGYVQSPGTECESTCECSPGQVQETGCGRCGVSRRVCGGNCRWGGWGACGSEGACSPGQVEEQACCSCGRTRRTCGGSCAWGGWSACTGPDPAGAPACDTGKPGACRDGRTRCVAGCLACVQTTPASDEKCDDVDNDCDGEVDEGSPSTVGTPPPAWAARITDASFPRHLPPGGEDTAWVVFRNLGRETWRARQFFLRADAPASGHASMLAPPSGWRAYDTPAVLDHDVAPGEDAAFVFPVALAPGDARDVRETFSLVTPGGKAIACPEGSAAISVASVEARVERVVQLKPVGDPIVSDEGCASAGPVPGGVVGLLLLFASRRRRSSRR